MSYADFLRAKRATLHRIESERLGALAEACRYVELGEADA